MHDGYDFLMVHNEYDNQANKVRFYVNDWPEKIAISKRTDNECEYADVDNNVVDFRVDNGIARYYIVKGLENDFCIYAKKFYSFSNPYHHTK